MARGTSNVTGIDLRVVVRYSCRVCGLADVEVSVPARESEDVAQWMNATVRLLGADHFQRQPECSTEVLNDIKVPLADGAKIGGATAQ